MPVVLRRLVETPQGTLGRLLVENGPSWYSMERRASGDHPRIPAGFYELKLDFYHHGGYAAYQILVPGRDRILIHAANRAVELLGCVAPGISLGFIAEQLAVLQSRAALKRFMEAMKEVRQDYLSVQDPPKEAV